MKDRILAAPQFRLIRREDTARATVRAMYEMALEIGGLPANHRESADDMMNRVGLFRKEWAAALDALQEEIYERHRIAGGAAAGLNKDEIKHLDKDAAREVFWISYACLEADEIKWDMVTVLTEFVTKEAA